MNLTELTFESSQVNFFINFRISIWSKFDKTFEYQTRCIRNKVKLIEPDRITKNTLAIIKYKIRRKLGYILNYLLLIFDSLFYAIKINFYIYIF